MKKRIIILFALVLAIVACFSGCSGVIKRTPAKGEIDRTYAVLSNGGSAVQYGEYIYFINGYRGYEDESGKENVWDKVDKGGLYRARLIDANHVNNVTGKIERDYVFSHGTETLNVFVPSADTQISGDAEFASNLEFKSTYNKYFSGYETDEEGVDMLDANDEKIPMYSEEYVVDVQLIVPKTIGTSGFNRGGIFIFDNFIFYASPNNNKNKEGKVQYNKTDFYRTTLDGSKTELIYTTSKESSTAEYVFYKWNGSYYLVTQDGTDIFSVKMGKKIGDAAKPKRIAEGASSVHFPSKDIYYNYTDAKGVLHQTPENGVEDFIYYTRSATSDDDRKNGDVIEMMRPNGSERIVIYNQGKTGVKLWGSDNGVLFYEVPNQNGQTITYTNLYSTLMGENKNGKKNSPTYYAAHKDSSMAAISDSITISVAFDTLSCVYPDPRNVGEVYIIGFGGSIGRQGKDGYKQLYADSGKFVKVDQGKLYFENNGGLKCINMYQGGTAQTIVEDALTEGPAYTFDILDGYAVFFGEIDQYAKDYAKFKSIITPESSWVFVGQRSKADQRPEEE